MKKDTSENVVSYRVREFDDQHYVVETYTMQLIDELSFYTEANPNYYIRYNSSLKGKHQFQKYIYQKCQAIGYENNIDYSNKDKDDIEEFNTFLAAHYFTQGISGDYIREINTLNELARQYIVTYNNSVRNFNNTTNVNIDKQLSRARSFLRNNITHVECMNVGQANFSIGYDSVENNPCAIFDIGIKSSSYAMRNRAYAKNKLQQIDGNGIVVISHYDFDHINGYRYINSESTDRIWILPEKRLSPTPTERNLLSILKPHNCIFLKDVDYSKMPFNPSRHILTIGNIEIYQGNAKKIDPFQSTNENARCLICLVKKEKSILLPADCLYEEFPTCFKADYIAVPHHCCFYDRPIKNINTSLLKELIVFAGPNNKYQHPDNSHIARLNPLFNQCAPYRTIYLMNNNSYYFDFKTKIINPPIATNRPSYTVTL